MGKLTIAKSRAITEPGMYHDSPTLYLYVAPGGSKSWVQRITIDGRRHDLGLGGFPLITPEHARRRAAVNRLEVADGKDPLAEKRKAKAPTFKQAALKTYETLRPRWRNDKVAKNWMQQLDRYVFQRFGNMRVDRIGRADVLSILTPIWNTKPETARRVRRSIRSTFSWCQANGFVDINYAGEVIDGGLPTMRALRKNLRALPYQELPEAIETVRASGASRAAKACLEFTILTACRSGEARHAVWSEIDLDERLWTIPAERTKIGREHRQPLSEQAIAVLQDVRDLQDDSGLIFPSPYKKGNPLSNMALTKVLRDNDLADRATVHGFRASFRTWASEKTNADHAVMELSLAHTVGSSVEQAYARSDLLAKRRRLMDQWGAFATGDTAGKVVQLHA
ncbi:MAG: tyrosine-type recombinase/integrase [Proteobacteria bacterium]|nr:tyrosine-type recombinase/integrase [Pseudomonadota bacterium]MYB89345.1 tyrosine-type recombinase/integrase [Pseudomonadota bacterium]